MFQFIWDDRSLPATLSLVHDSCLNSRAETALAEKIRNSGRKKIRKSAQRWSQEPNGWLWNDGRFSLMVIFVFYSCHNSLHFALLWKKTEGFIFLTSFLCSSLVMAVENKIQIKLKNKYFKLWTRFLFLRAPSLVALSKRSFALLESSSSPRLCSLPRIS